MELSAIVSGIGILEGMISNAIYDLLKSRLKKESLTKDDVASIVYDALRETQDIYLKKYSEMLHQALGAQNETLVGVIVQQVSKLLEQYKVPPIKRGVAQAEEARRVASKIAHDIGSHLIQHSQLFLLVSKEMLRSEDFKRSPFIFAQAERFLRKSPKIFQKMLREYLAAAEEEAVRRSLGGDPESAIVLYETLLPSYRLILHDTEKSAKILSTLADYFLAKKDLKKAARYYKLLDRKKAIELYEKMARYREVITCYVLEGQLREAQESYEEWKEKRKEWEAQGERIKRKLGNLKKSREKSKRDELEDFRLISEEMDLEMKHLDLLHMHVESWEPDYLSIDAIIKSWKEALYGSLDFYRKIGRTLKSEEQYANEGLYHLAAISYLRLGRNDLAREFFEKAIERFDKTGHQKALEGDAASFRIFLKKFCCQLLIAGPEIGPDVMTVKRDSLGWNKLIDASKTLQMVFELKHQKKVSKELLSTIFAIYDGLRIELID